MYSTFFEHFSNGRAAQSEEKFYVAKECYDKARETMEMILSEEGSDELLRTYAALLLRISVVELQLGNIKAAKGAVEESIQYNPTAEVCMSI